MVLVEIIEPMQVPEVRIPSLVWVESLHGFVCNLPSAGYEFIQKGWKVFGACAYREFGIVVDQFRVPGVDHSHRNVVQGAAKVMEDISRKEGEIWRNRREILDAIGDCSGFQIRLAEDGARIEIPKEVLDLGFDLSDVLFGPMQLE